MLVFDVDGAFIHRLSSVFEYGGAYWFAGWIDDHPIAYRITDDGTIESRRPVKTTDPVAFQWGAREYLAVPAVDDDLVPFGEDPLTQFIPGRRYGCRWATGHGDPVVIVADAVYTGPVVNVAEVAGLTAAGDLVYRAGGATVTRPAFDPEQAVVDKAAFNQLQLVDPGEWYCDWQGTIYRCLFRGLHWVITRHTPANFAGELFARLPYNYQNTRLLAVSPDERIVMLAARNATAPPTLIRLDVRSGQVANEYDVLGEHARTVVGSYSSDGATFMFCALTRNIFSDEVLGRFVVMDTE